MISFYFEVPTIFWYLSPSFLPGTYHAFTFMPQFRVTVQFTEMFLSKASIHGLLRHLSVSRTFLRFYHFQFKLRTKCSGSAVGLRQTKLLVLFK